MSNAIAQQEVRVRSDKRFRWLSEIRHYQRTCDPLIPRIAFQRLARELSQDYKIECM